MLLCIKKTGTQLDIWQHEGRGGGVFENLENRVLYLTLKKLTLPTGYSVSQYI